MFLSVCVCQLNVSVCLCLSVWLSLLVHPHVCVGVHVCVHVCACLPVHLPASHCLPLCLPVCLSVCLSLWCLHAHLSIKLHTPPLLVFPVWLSSLSAWKVLLGRGAVWVSVCLPLSVWPSLFLYCFLPISLSLCHSLPPCLSFLSMSAGLFVHPPDCLPRLLWSILSICASLSVCLSVCLTV